MVCQTGGLFPSHLSKFSSIPVRRHNKMKTPASGRLDSPCGRIGGGSAAARQASLAANAPKREFHATFVGGHINPLKPKANTYADKFKEQHQHFCHSFFVALSP
jgi:hypothetical protein